MANPLTQPPEARWSQITTAWLAAFLIGALTPPRVQAAPVPDFTLQLLDGKSITLQDYRGKSVLINFWYSR